MDDKRRTLAAVTLIIGFFVLVVVVVGVLVTSKKIVSPVPEDSGIKIIFVTPTPPAKQDLASPGTPSATVQVTPKATSTPKSAP